MPLNRFVREAPLAVLDGRWRDIEGCRGEAPAGDFHRIIPHAAAHDEGRSPLCLQVVASQPLSKAWVGLHVRPGNTITLEVGLSIERFKPRRGIVVSRGSFVSISIGHGCLSDKFRIDSAEGNHLTRFHLMPHLEARRWEDAPRSAERVEATSCAVPSHHFSSALS